MDYKELINGYLNLLETDKQKFTNHFNRIKELEKEENFKKKMDAFESMSELINKDGTPYFNIEWLKKTCLGI